MAKIRRARRTAAAMIEFAVGLSVLLLLVLGLIVVGLGIFRYNQVAHLAREGARFACVRGSQYASEENTKAATAEDVTAFIKDLAVGLDLDAMACTVTWDKSNAPTYADPNSTPPGRPVANRVIVTVNYKWSPEWLTELLGAEIVLSSTADLPMEH